MVKKALPFLLLAGLVSTAAAAPKKTAKAQPLAPGRYTAHVGMLACSACGENVEQVLNDTKGIENAKVDSDKSQVSFEVKPGAKIDLKTLQKALTAKADEMGMGADYRLSKITALKKS